MLPILALLLAAFTWGLAFCFLKQILDFLNPYYLLAFRFSLAAVLLCFLFLPRFKKLDRNVLHHGIFMGIILYFEFLFFTVGLPFTTASKAALICAGYTILMPAVYYGIVRKAPTRYEILASFVCMAGLVCILFSDLSGLNIGDGLCCLSALLYAVHIVYTGIFAKEDDPILLNILQIGTSAVLSWLFALFTGPLPLPIPAGALSGIFYLAVVCTVVPYFLSIYGQKHVKTSTSAILLSFESVFGAGLSILILHEPFTAMFAVGTLLVVCSTFLSEKKAS